MTNIASVNVDHMPNIMYNLTAPQCVSLVRPNLKTIFHSTSDNSVKKNHIYILCNAGTSIINYVNLNMKFGYFDIIVLN